MKVKTNKPDRKWLRRARGSGFTINTGKKEHLSLKKALLGIGGWGVCIIYEPYVQLILDRGRRFPAKSISMKGEPCRCHSNSALCWDENRERCRICTGYALSKDGMWRQHSWVYDLIDKVVIETTEKRVAYWGILLEVPECEAFLMSND